MPAEVCRGCGTRFYRAEVLHAIERCFFAMEDERAVDYVKMSVTAYAAMCLFAEALPLETNCLCFMNVRARRVGSLSKYVWSEDE